MKKEYLLVLLLVPLLLCGCEETQKTKVAICKKDLGYGDSQITWNNEITINYDVNDRIEGIKIDEIIAIDESVSEERVNEFVGKMEAECTSDLGLKFDSCTINKRDNNTYVITLKTSKIEVLDSAINSSTNGGIETNSNMSAVKKYLEDLKYSCKEE